MSFLNQYAIKFTGLKPGTHSFRFDVSDKFFDEYEFSEIKKGKINVMVELEKQSSLMVLNLSIDGSVVVMCDRCLEDFNFPVDSSHRIIVKFGEKNEETDDMIMLSESEHEINMAQYIYEYIHLALPLKRVHPDDDKGHSLCDADILKKLEELKVKESSGQADDSRWESLQKIKFN